MPRNYIEFNVGVFEHDGNFAGYFMDTPWENRTLQTWWQDWAYDVRDSQYHRCYFHINKVNVENLLTWPIGLGTPFEYMFKNPGSLSPINVPSMFAIDQHVRKKWPYPLIKWP